MLPEWVMPAIVVLFGSMVVLTVLAFVLWFSLAGWMRRLDRKQVARVEARLIERFPASTSVGQS